MLKTMNTPTDPLGSDATRQRSARFGERWLVVGTAILAGLASTAATLVSAISVSGLSEVVTESTLTLAAAALTLVVLTATVITSIRLREAISEERKSSLQGYADLKSGKNIRGAIIY